MSRDPASDPLATDFTCSSPSSATVGAPDASGYAPPGADIRTDAASSRTGGRTPSAESGSQPRAARMDRRRETCKFQTSKPLAAGYSPPLPDAHCHRVACPACDSSFPIPHAPASRAGCAACRPEARPQGAGRHHNKRPPGARCHQSLVRTGCPPLAPAGGAAAYLRPIEKIRGFAGWAAGGLPERGGCTADVGTSTASRTEPRRTASATTTQTVLLVCIRPSSGCRPLTARSHSDATLIL